MLKESTIKRFIWAAKEDYGAELTYEEAAKILEGTVAYLLTLEKIYLRIQNKKNNPEKNESK
ncbi:MAG: hypothetical protein NTV36_03525 [Candidatus Staskawiczbacteria bacterium]|nr:hypothetical protein [Candidatus Staskawiczbacteria bacterium]